MMGGPAWSPRRLLRTRPERAAAVLNVEEMRKRAQQRLPRAVFDVIDGGAGDELTVRGNREAFERLWIRARAFADVSHRDLSTTVLGSRIELPIMLAPCAYTRMCDSGAELAVNRAASAAGTIYAVTTATTFPLEEVRQASTGPSWFQLYTPPTREETRALVERVRQAGYDVLCVTVDTAAYPIRDRDIRNGLTVPLKITPSLIRQGASRPMWSKDFLLGRVGQATPGMTAVSMRDFTRMLQWVRSNTIDEVAWLKEIWGGPLVVKGIMRGEEVPAMVDVGVDGVVVSNHGGRNLDGAVPSIECLPEIVQAANGRMEVYVDGGVRRGGDVLKALALGARAVLVGRPYMYGLGAYGEAGVAQVLEILGREFESAMAFAGCASVADIDSSIVRSDRDAAEPLPRWNPDHHATVDEDRATAKKSQEAHTA